MSLFLEKVIDNNMLKWFFKKSYEKDIGRKWAGEFTVGWLVAYVVLTYY